MAVLQKWITVEGGANNNAVQSFAHNLDIEPAGSIVPYVEISNFSGAGAHLQIQTSPTPDNGFYSMPDPTRGREPADEVGGLPEGLPVRPAPLASAARAAGGGQRSHAAAHARRSPRPRGQPDVDSQDGAVPSSST